MTMKSDYKVIATYPSVIDESITFGFTYVVDTYLFHENNRQYLSQCNECENRVSSSFDGVLFKNYWNYTLFPSDPKLLGNDTHGHLEYPNPNIWDLSMADAYTRPCGQVQWTNTFTMNELLNNCGFEWKDSGMNENTIDLHGNFYLV